MGTTVTRPKLLFFVTEDWYFCSHRLALGKAAVQAGYQVVLVTRVGTHRDLIESVGIQVIALEQHRGSLNPLREIQVFLKLWNIYRQEKPDLVHHVAIKPVVFGGLIARLVGIQYQVNALAGLGWVYASHRILRRSLGIGISLILRTVLQSGFVIVQNSDDQRWVQNLGVPAPQVHMVRGSGVDLEMFHPAKKVPNTCLTVLLVSRMIWTKGIREFVEAARILRQRNLAVRFALVGSPDPANRESLSETQLQRWQKDGCVEWWGQHEDIAECYSHADIACLPSYYGEGLPKSLLEATASGLPVVTTDAPGCREIVKHGQNGFLVPVRDPYALADALEKLIQNSILRTKMGRVSRELAEREFSAERVVTETLGLYKKLLKCSVF